MLIDLNEVLKNDGKTMQAEVPLSIDSYSNGTDTFPIVSNQPVSLLISNKGNRELQITGSIHVVLVVPCDRCLEDVRVALDLDIDQEVDMSQTEEERRETLDEQFYIEGYNLDVDKLVCSEILVSWPSKVLCKEDCKGLCNTCGTNLNLKTCDCEPTDLDPRMAQIQEIFSKFKEV
ncbi:MAG: YceD family protein [Muricoprocola sp.]